MAVHRHLVRCQVRERATQHIEDCFHHQLAVEAGIELRPADRAHISGEMLGALRQIGKILVRQIDKPAAHLLLRELDEIGPELVADAA